MAWILVAVLSILAFWLFALNRYSHRKRLSQNSYIVFLLLSDEVREGQREQFLDYLHKTRGDAQDAESFAPVALQAVESAADQLAESDAMPSVNAVLWNYDQFT